MEGTHRGTTGYWWLLGKGDSISFRDVTLGKLPLLQWVGTHPRTYWDPVALTKRVRKEKARDGKELQRREQAMD